MSAIPLEDAIERESTGVESRTKLPPKALVYFLFVGAVAIAVTAPFLAQLDQTTGNWFEFAILAASVALAQFFVVRTPGNKSYHTTGVFLIAAVLLLPPALAGGAAVDPAHPRMAAEPRHLVRPDHQHPRLHDRDDGGVGGCRHRDGRGRPGRERRHSLRARRHRRLGRARGAQLGAAGAHDPLGQRPPDAPALLVPDALDGIRLRGARRRPRRLLDRQPLARPVRDRPAAADPPGSVGAAAAGRGARRPEDRPLQRTLLRFGADGGAQPRTALRAPAVADHGRPRPAPRDQQHLRPSRRRRGAEGHRRGLPRRAPALRRAGPVRRRGVLDPPAGDVAGEGARDRRADPPLGRGAAVRRRDVERADPRNRLDRRRRLPEGRPGPERAHPPGRPGRLPREAPGPQPCPRRELRAAADAGRPERAPRRRARGRRPSRAARARPGGVAGAGAPPHGAHDQRSTLPPALDPPRPARRARDVLRRLGGHPGCDLRHVHGRDRDPRRDRARQRGGGARARARRRLDLRQRRRRARRRCALRATSGAGDGRGDLRRPVERAAPADSSRAVQHRHALAVVTRGGLGLHARLQRRAGASSSPSLRASSPARSTSRSTRGCSRSHSPSRDARTSGASGTSASSGWRRTTSSTASSAA